MQFLRSIYSRKGLIHGKRIHVYRSVCYGIKNIETNFW